MHAGNDRSLPPRYMAIPCHSNPIAQGMHSLPSLHVAVHTLMMGSTINEHELDAINSDCDAQCGDLGGTFYEHLGLCECHGKQV